MSLLATRVQELRLQSPNIDRFTNRASRYGALDAFITSNNDAMSIVTPEMINQVAGTAGRDVKIPVFDSESVSIGSTRSVTIADSQNTSALLTLSSTVYSWGFTVTPSEYLNSDTQAQADFNRKYLKYIYKFADTLDTACLTSLNTNKTQVWGDYLEYTDPTTTSDVVPAALADKDNILSDLSVMMKANDYYGVPYRVVGNTGLEAILRQQEKYGQFNEQNKAIEWADKTFHFTNNQANALNKIATGYIVNPGSLGMLFKHEPDAVIGSVLPDGTEWGMITDDFTGVPISTYTYFGPRDASSISGAATAHLTRAATEYYGFSAEVINVVAYIDDLTTVASPIMKFDVANS